MDETGEKKENGYQQSNEFEKRTIHIVIEHVILIRVSHICA